LVNQPLLPADPDVWGAAVDIEFAFVEIEADDELANNTFNAMI
jgi:hypothetical protein